MPLRTATPNRLMKPIEAGAQPDAACCADNCLEQGLGHAAVADREDCRAQLADENSTGRQKAAINDVHQAGASSRTADSNRSVIRGMDPQGGVVADGKPANGRTGRAEFHISGGAE